MSSQSGSARAAMRAVAHPTRLAILELLGAHQTVTATECAQTLGLTPKTCSYHLQALAAGGYVEEVPVAGRNRPWRRTGKPVPAEHTGGVPAGRVPASGVPGGAALTSGTGGTAGGSPARYPEQATSAPAAPRSATTNRNARDARLRREESLLGDAANALLTAAGLPGWADSATVHTRIATMSAEDVRAWADEVERITSRHVRRAAAAAETAVETAAGTAGEAGQQSVARVPVHLLFFGFPAPDRRP